MTPVFKIPRRFIDVQYDSLRIPGVKNQSDLTLGANCQVYAYELLQYFGKSPLLFRSSELWADCEYSKEVEEYKILDLMLYNKTPKSYEAHVGVYVGDGMVLHLSKEEAYPVIQKHEDLLLKEKYTFFIGAKRVVA